MSENGEKAGDSKKSDKRGILRLDISKPRHSAGSVEFRHQPELLSETTPSPQPTLLSVKWASSNDNEYELQLRKDRLPSLEKRSNKSLSADYFGFQSYSDQNYPESIDNSEYLNSEDDDYSFSLSRVLHRRASSRRRGYHSPRRTSTSSQMAHISSMSGNSANIVKADRRRSSVYTTSSGETGISMGDGANNNQDSTKEQIFENIRLHKEVLQSVKMQPWSMRRKLRLVRQAREYIARHEGALQERFAMSRSTKDLWARFKIVLAVKWQHFRRELVNFSTIFVPWQLRIKEIESHFGSVVASYFTFLRWLFWVNIVLASTLSTFVILPEFLASQYSGQDDHRKVMMTMESENATRLTTFLNFEGYLKYSPLFYGYYSDYSGIVRQGYNLPLAYFFAGVAVYIYSFWATLRKMADNSRMSKMSSKEDECIFSWKLFTGWDYMIGHAETAHNRIASVVLGFKEALLEEAEKKKDKQNWRVIVLRVIVNILILCLLVLSASAVVIVVDRSSDQTKNYSYWRRNETSFVMTGISFFFPMCFEFLGYLENYHPRKQLRWQLGRIMLLNLLNLFSLIIALFKKIYLMNMELERLRQCPSREDPTINATMQSFTTDDTTDYTDITAYYTTMFQTATSDLFSDFFATSTTEASAAVAASAASCHRVLVACTKPANIAQAMMTTMLLLNFKTTVLPEIAQQTKMTDAFTSTFPSTYHYDVTNATGDWSDVYNFTGTPELFSETTEMATETDGMASTTVGAWTATATSGDDYFDYGTDGFDAGGTIADKRERRSIESTDYLAWYDEFETTTATPAAPEDSDYTMDGDNITQVLSTTVMSFLETLKTNPTVDLSNETDVSQAWTEYLTTNNDNLFTATEPTRPYTTEANVDYRTTAASAADYEVDENGNCYVEVCDPYVSSTEPPYESFESFARTTDGVVEEVVTEPPPPPTPSTTPTPSPTTEPPTMAPAILNKTDTNSTNVCVPFRRNHADNITGIPPEYVGRELRRTINKMNVDDQLELRDLCWETLFGQELVKLTVLDLIFTIITTLFMDFFRALFVRFMNKFWCWDLEKRWPKYGDFKIAENILHLVNNQGQVWMGMFFSPGLAILNLIKLGILMYFRSWAVLTCNVPHEVVFRASRSNNFYLALLLTMLFLCVLPVSYAIVWIEPSWHCGPFANHARIHRVFTDTLKRTLPKTWHLPMDIIASPSTVIPLLLLLILIIYYLISLTGALREANQDLKNQLRRERQEERRKMLQRVVNAKLDDGGGNNAIDRWRKVLEASSPVTPSLVGQQSEPDEEKLKARREFLARIMKKALRKSSNTSDEESRAEQFNDGDGDETDAEQNEPLPHDQETTGPAARKHSSAQIVVEDRKGNRTTRRKSSLNHGHRAVDAANEKPDHRGADQRHHHKAAGKRGEADKRTDKRADDHEDKISVVSERRALRRQRHTRESDGNISVQTATSPDTPTAADTAVGAPLETKPVAQGPSTKPSPKVRSSPEIFRFGSDAADDKAAGRPATASALNGCDDDVGRVATTKDRGHAKPISPTSNNVAPHEIVEAKSPTQITPEKARASDSELLKQPMKKINSFIHLVREAVQPKHKAEQPANGPESPAIPPIPANDLQMRCKSYIDDSNPMSMSEECGSIKTFDSITSSSSSKVTYFESTRRKHRSDPPKPKRRDSQASIWSEQIPVIRISKSESDECILEKDTTESEPIKTVTQND